MKHQSFILSSIICYGLLRAAFVVKPGAPQFENINPAVGPW